ncbi:hypothetical protein Tco_1405112 [Tanacetum coccineum]
MKHSFFTPVYESVCWGAMRVIYCHSYSEFYRGSVDRRRVTVDTSLSEIAQVVSTLEEGMRLCMDSRVVCGGRQFLWGGIVLDICDSSNHLLAEE